MRLLLALFYGLGWLLGLCLLTNAEGLGWPFIGLCV